jgi:capsular polysaccharide biosynthesis protein
MLFMYDGDQLPELLGEDGYTYIDDGSADLATGVTSLRFIRAVLRRTRRVWGAVALVGFAAGIGIAVTLPVTYQASTSLLLTPMSAPAEASGGPILNEQALAQSRPVAELAVRQLGLQQSVTKFLTTYTATAATDRVLVITAKANSSAEALARARAVATEFLRFRANLAETAQNLVLRSLDQEVLAAQQRLQSINTQISQLPARPTTPEQQARLASLEKAQAQAQASLDVVLEAVTENSISSQITTAGVVLDSQVLSPASPVPPHSRLKRLLEYAGIGLIASLTLGVGFVIIGALLSDRLRRRDEVARALRAPVEVSVGSMARPRWWPGPRELQAAPSAEVKRIVAYLDDVLSSSTGDPMSLAIVPVDDVHGPAVCLVSLAISCAKRGLRVVVADLCDGAPAARLVGVAEPGIHTVTVQSVQIVVVAPDQHDVVIRGPLDRPEAQTSPAEAVIEACATADRLLTLAALDPSLGAQHLSGWARAAVATVTAGQSTGTRIQAVSEMVRLAGIPLVSGVLIGADKTDESLGAAPAAGVGDAIAAEPDSRLDGDGSVVHAADQSAAGRPGSDRHF